MQDLAQASDALAEAGFAVPRWADLPRHCPAPAPDDADPDDPDVPYRGWQRSAFFFFLASSTIVPRPSTAAPSGLQSSHSSTHSPALSPPGCSLFALSAQSSPSTQLPSGSCFSVACGSLYHLLLHDAAVGVRLVLLVTTSLPAPGLVFPGHGVDRSNFQAHRHDERGIEVIANGLPLWGGSQLAVDTTLVSPLTSAGVSGAGEAAPLEQRWLKHAGQKSVPTPPEFADARRCRLVVLGLEVGGRWSAEAAAFIRLLARARARSAAVTQCAACVAAFVIWWSGLLSIAAARSFAASLLSLPISNTANLDSVHLPHG